MKVVIICFIVMFLLCLTLLMLVIVQNKELKTVRYSLSAEKEYSQNLKKELERMRKANEIRVEEHNVAEEQINSLHNGDAVTNAINSLSKHK